MVSCMCQSSGWDKNKSICSSDMILVGMGELDRNVLSRGTDRGSKAEK